MHAQPGPALRGEGRLSQAGFPKPVWSGLQA
jgi:hypothetical protein